MRSRPPVKATRKNCNLKRRLLESFFKKGDKLTFLIRVPAFLFYPAALRLKFVGELITIGNCEILNNREKIGKEVQPEFEVRASLIFV